MLKLECKGRSLSLARPQIMGILNVTPDSFSDGARFMQPDQALARAAQLVADGATLLDIGGESTRPGAADVAEQEELDRVIPVVERVARELDVMISVDTSKAKVMAEACRAGAHLINDVRALQEPGALEAAAASQALICLMHMQGQPRTMQQSPQYADLFADIDTFFRQRIAACDALDIPSERLVLDPGFGFGKTLEQNYRLLGGLQHFAVHGLPLLVGMSRKSMIGQLLDRPVNERMAGSLGAALFAVGQGASIIRVHDVRETHDALRVFLCAAEGCGGREQI